MRPLKFLDAYQRDDFSFFFGRTAEVDDLNQKIRQSRVLVFYGLSGTGKTSVVRCGLANKLDPMDCHEVYIRREGNFTASIGKAIQEAAITFIPGDVSNINALKVLYMESLRPIFLLFDQFEELFISGGETELKEFCSFLKDALSDQFVNVNVLLIIREEYMGQLEKLEHVIPSIYSNKQRLERMTPDQVVGVIKDILDFGGIKHKEKDKIPKLIADKGQLKGQLVNLPDLQVLLDRIFDTVPEEAGVKRTLVPGDIDSLGKMEEIMGDYLERCLSQISAEEKERDTEYAWRILKAMITGEGTKKVVKTAELLGAVGQTGNIDREETKLNIFLSRLQGARIIRMIDIDQFEIAHDSLCLEITKKRTPEELKILESERLVRSKYLTRTKGALKDELTYQQIMYIEPNREKLRLGSEELQFLDESAKKVKGKQKMWRIFWVIGIFTLIAIATIAQIGTHQATIAKEKAEVQQRRADSLAKRADSLLQQSIFSELEAKKNAKLADSNATIAIQNANEAKLNADRANKNKELADQKTDEAEANLEQANDNLAKADVFSKRADYERAKAVAERKKAQANNLALQSILEPDRTKKLVKALQAHCLNKEANGGQWLPEIVSALMNAIPSSAIKEVRYKNVSMADLLNVNGRIIAISDLGQIFPVNIESSENQKALSDSLEFYYMNNSAWVPDSKNQLIASDLDNFQYSFSIDKGGFRFNEKSKTTKVTDTRMFKLSPGGILKRLDNNRYEIFQSFDPQQYGSALAIGPTYKGAVSNDVLVAAGTTNGWLYLRNGSIVLFAGQYHRRETPLLDVAIDPLSAFVASGGNDSKFRLHKVSMIHDRLPVEWQLSGWVTAVLFLNNDYVIAATHNGTIYRFDYNPDRLAEAGRQILKQIYSVYPETKTYDETGCLDL